MVSLILGAGPSSPPVAPTLNALTLTPNTATVGTPYSGTISGKTAASVIALSGGWATVSGTSVTGTPTAAASLDLTETLAGATNSPRTTPGALRVAAAGATPDGPMEALITPPNTTQRSTYSVAKQGVATDIYPEMYRASDGTLNGNGVYWAGGGCPKVPHPQWPDRRFGYSSCDHGSATGPEVGIYASVCVGNPGVPANWKMWRQAWDAGWLPELSTRPTSDIVYKGATGTAQPETPWVQYVTDANGANGLYVMAYQTGNNARYPDNSVYPTQATVRATSPDGINWTGNLFAWAITPADVGGPSFTTYLRFAKNVLFTEVPYGWIAFGLGGLYGCNDPRTENWTLISRTAHQGVRYVGGMTSGYLLQKGRYDPTTAVMTRQGISMLVQIGLETSGLGIAEGGLYEVLIAPDGVEILAAAQLVVNVGTNNTDPDKGMVDLGSVMTYGPNRVIMYEGAGNTDGTGAHRRALVATGQLRDPQNTWFNPLNPPTPALANLRKSELSFRSGLPAGLTLYTTGTPGITYDATNGMVIDLKDGDKVVIVENQGFMPGTTTFVDFLVRDWSVLSNDAFRIPWFGFTADPGALDAMQDVRAFTYDQTTPTTSIYYKKTGGVVSTTASSDTSVEARNEGYGAANALAKVRKDTGMRWFPQSANNAAIRMVWGGAETASLTSVMDFANATRSKRWYRFIAFEGKGVTQVALRGWRLRDDDTSGGTVPLVTTFDPNNKSSLITLADANMTANAAPGSLNQIRGVRALYAVPSGRFYAEGIMALGNSGFGIVNSAFAISSGAQGTANSVLCQGDGDVQRTDGGQTSVAALARAANNDVRTMLVDTTLGKIWFGRIPAAGGATIWDGDPNAGTGGYALPSAGGPYYAWADMFISSGNTYKITANFGATAFIGTLPTGAASYNSAARA